MTVKELIKALEKMPQDLEVVAYTSGAHNVLKTIDECSKERSSYIAFTEFGLKRNYDDCVKIY